ncbi:hypothetical protein O181_065833 [Austropuccinia psidii MF-1]|uniref:Uncharacterized protein n=1 Tax=Austropuccinia psidii MF-1 TaxID=1389203 RepID=A0A9Q3I302_9BASI|nr:hypothetical protein [Austropuccinia psidii MF-1]
MQMYKILVHGITLPYLMIPISNETQPDTYSLPSTIVEPPVPSTFPLETPTTAQFLMRKKIPNIHHMSPPADLHNMNLLILTMTDVLKYKPIAYPILQVSSPNFPSNATTPINATTPHVVSSLMHINHAKSSHTLSPPHFENPKNNLLPSQSNPPTPSNAPTPGIRDPSNHLHPFWIKLTKILQNHSLLAPPMINSLFSLMNFDLNFMSFSKNSPISAPPRPNTKPHSKQLTHLFPGTTKIWAPNSLQRGIPF